MALLHSDGFFGQGRAQSLIGRIAAELAAPQGEPWRFLADFLPV
jgi:hypothetical protein